MSSAGGLKQLVIQSFFLVITGMRGRQGVTKQHGCKIEYVVQTNNISLMETEENLTCSINYNKF